MSPKIKWHIYVIVKPLYDLLKILKKSCQNRNFFAQIISATRSHGWNIIFSRLFNHNYIPWKLYDVWLDKYEIKNEDYPLFQNKINSWHRTPLISIIMPVYNPDSEYLIEAIESVKKQIYPYWELCIADDASSEAFGVKTILNDYVEKDSRIKVIFRSSNGHISAASNSAMTLATGEFVALLDHDDMLHPLALWFLADTIIRHPTAGLIYTDHDKLSLNGKRCNPYFKCDFNLELMLAHNLIAHLSCYRRSLLAEIGGFREGFEGSQDYDLALRCIERLKRNEIIHIPHVLYHWRMSLNSTSLTPDAKPYAFANALRSISDYLKRNNLPGKVVAHPKLPSLSRVQPEFLDPLPLVSIIIPTKDRVDLLEPCISTIRSLTTYCNYEIIVVDNGSKEDTTMTYFEQLQQQGINIIRDEGEFNYSRLNNLAVGEANGNLLCFLNNDTQIISPNWLEEMVFFAIQSEVGVVGAKLYNLDNTVQHAGVILGIGIYKVAAYAFDGLSSKAPGYMGRAAVHQELSALTGACQLVRKSVFSEVGGLDESLAVAYNDIDFCLKVHRAGYRNIWTPFAELYHVGSASRGIDISSQQVLRLKQESNLMQQRWGNILLNDPYYSPNLSLNRPYALACPPRNFYHNQILTEKI